MHTIDEGAYYHEAFLRGLPDLTCFIRRLPPSAGGKPLPNPEKEPRFLEMNPLPSSTLVLPKSCSTSKARTARHSKAANRSKVARIKIQSATQGCQKGEGNVNNSGTVCTSSNVARSIVSTSSSMPSWEDMPKVMMPVDDHNANAATRECWECFSFYCNC